MRTLQVNVQHNTDPKDILTSSRKQTDMNVNYGLSGDLFHKELISYHMSF